MTDTQLIKIEGHTFNSAPLGYASIVVDVGGNHGEFSHAVIQKYRCYVECFEPDIEGFFLISNRILDESFIVHNRAVAGQTGIRTFYRAGAVSGGNSILPGHSEFANSGECSETYEVFALSLECILRRLPRVDLLKLDCEGAELEIIANTSRNAFEKVQQLTVEFHEFCFDDQNKQDIEAAIATLIEYGFKATPPENPNDYSDRHFYRQW